MQTVIRSSDFELTEALNSFIKDQASRTMKVCSNKVERLVVRLKDTNDPQQEKECVVEVQLPNHATIVVSKKNANAYASIREALERASRTALRKLKKRRDRQYSHQM
jgi:ribosomal subunit interface protein